MKNHHFYKSIFTGVAFVSIAVPSILTFTSCERLDDDLDRHRGSVQLEHVAKLLSVLPIEQEQLDEVHRAVSSSSGNGYDEEYMMSDLFDLPGKGVGETGTKAVPQYSRAMRDLLREYVSENGGKQQKRKVRFVGTKAAASTNITSGTKSTAGTKSSSGVKSDAGVQSSYSIRSSYGIQSSAGTETSEVTEGLGFVPDEKFLADMENSDMQIYWPYSENWDGETLPIISFDPEDGSETSTGYRLLKNDDGTAYVEMLVVNEEMAKETPVWVVNTNSDSDYMTLDLMRRNDPSYSEGGTVIVRPNKTMASVPLDVTSESETVSAVNKTLILKEFTAKRNFDCWLAGASEFFVKAGAVEDFHASTEAELRLYSPSITDFMVVVKRKQVGQPIPFNAVIVSEWSPDMTHCAFMITEDDGGTVTQWKCSAIVKVASKSYGFDISLPFNSRDDIVWRGQLSRKYLESNSNVTGHFGDVDLVFEIVDMP